VQTGILSKDDVFRSNLMAAIKPATSIGFEALIAQLIAQHWRLNQTFWRTFKTFQSRYEKIELTYLPT
jgi:hypothetical protein